MRAMVVHFAGGTEVTIETAVAPEIVSQGLADADSWLVVEDTSGEAHYLAVRHVAYLTFNEKKELGFGA